MTALPEPADIIKQVLADSKLSQQRWARHLGYSQKYLSQVAHGRARVSVQFAVRFEKVSGVSARGLLRMQADLDLRVYLRVEAERNGQTSRPDRMVERPGELAGPSLDRPRGQPNRGLVRNARPTRYTGGR